MWIGICLLLALALGCKEDNALAQETANTDASAHASGDGGASGDRSATNENDEADRGEGAKYSGGRIDSAENTDRGQAGAPVTHGEEGFGRASGAALDLGTPKVDMVVERPPTSLTFTNYIQASKQFNHVPNSGCDAITARDQCITSAGYNWLRTLKNNDVCREVPVSRCLLAEECECGNLPEEFALGYTFAHATP